MDNEIKCQKKLKSNNIVNIYDVYDTNSFTFIVCELCEGGDLFKLLRYSKGGLSDKFVTKIGFDVAQALLKMK